MNKVLKSVLNEKEDRLIDKPNIQSLYICATNAIVPFRLTPSETTILFVCASFSEKNGTSITVGNDYLEEKTGFTQNTIGKAKKGLMAKGLLVREGFGNFGVAKYRLNLPGHHMYVDPKQTAKITPLPTSYQEEENEVQQTSPAPQEVQVQVQQVLQATPLVAAPQEDQELASIFDEDQAAPPVEAPQEDQVQVQPIPSIVDGTAYYPSDQADNSRDEDHDIKQLVIMRNAKKKGAPINFAASCKRFGIDLNFFEDFCKSDLLKDWSITSEMEHIILKKPVEEWDFTFSIPCSELTAVNSGQETELPF